MGRQDDSSDDDMIALMRLLKRPRCDEVISCHVDASTGPSKQAELFEPSAPSQVEHAIAEVDWLRFLEPEIKKAKAAFADRPMLINTSCSGIGAPTVALQEPTATNNNTQFQP